MTWCLKKFFEIPGELYSVYGTFCFLTKQIFFFSVNGSLVLVVAMQSEIYIKLHSAYIHQ